MVINEIIKLNVKLIIFFISLIGKQEEIKNRKHKNKYEF